MATYLGAYSESYGPYQSAGAVTPAPPSWSFNTQTRVLSLSHATLGASELEFSYQNAAYQQYVAGLSVDANAHPAGDWKGRVKAATGRNPSNAASSPAIQATAAPGPPPTITTVTPNADSPGHPITLIGTYYGATQGSSSVDFAGVSTTVVSWSDQQVTVLVPTGTPATGRWHLTTANGTATSPSDFTVTTPAPADNTPTITSFSPTSGPPGTTIVLTGTNFTGASAVSVNSQGQAYTVNSATQITTTAGTSAGPIRVTANGKTGQSLIDFQITLPAFTVKRQVVFEGDSQMFPYYGDTDQGGLAFNIRHILGEDNYGDWFNGATPSEEIARDMIGQIPMQFGMPSPFYYDNIAILYAGINDLIHHPDFTAQQLYDADATWHQRMQALGWKTVDVTLPNYNGGDDTTLRASINARIDAYNAMKRANPLGTVFADVGANPNLDPRTHPENYNPDGLHFNYKGGSQLVAAPMAAAVRSIPLPAAGNMMVDKSQALFFGSANNPANTSATFVDESGHSNAVGNTGFVLAADASGLPVYHSSDRTSYLSLSAVANSGDYEMYAVVNIQTPVTNGYFFQANSNNVILALGTVLADNPAAYFLASTNQFVGRMATPLNTKTLVRWRFESASKLGGCMNTAGITPTSITPYPTPFSLSAAFIGQGVQGDLYSFVFVPRLLSHQEAYAWSTYLAQQAGLTL
jgi:lysophospholipase L1-like esterase